MARHLPGYDVRSVVPLGEGLDNVAYEVNGELIVRASKEADPAERAEAIGREANLLAVVAELSTLPVPEVAFADLEAGVLAYRKLPGRPLLETPALPEPDRLGAPLGEFLTALHRAPVGRMAQTVPVDDEPLAVWLADARHAYEHAYDDAYEEVTGRIPERSRRTVEQFLGRTPPAEPPTRTFCHNDLGAEHVLVSETGTITGVIDWTDAAIADPVHDLALIYRDLGPEVLDLTMRHYGGELDGAAMERVRFYARCALLEDLAYGIRTRAHRYTEAALANLDHTFA